MASIPYRTGACRESRRRGRRTTGAAGSACGSTHGPMAGRRVTVDGTRSPLRMPLAHAPLFLPPTAERRERE